VPAELRHAAVDDVDVLEESFSYTQLKHCARSRRSASALSNSTLLIPVK